MTSASALVPLWDRAAEWRRRLAMIREARSFLYLSTFYVEHDAYGVEVLAELVSAQRRGVAVNLLIDGFGQRLGGVLMSSQQRVALAGTLEDLRRAGAVVTVYSPQRHLQRWLGGGQHVKIQVSDAGEAIFGSSNLSKSSFEGWNEYAVAVRGPVAHALLSSYRDIGGVVHASHLHHLRSGVPAVPTAEIESSEVAKTMMLEYWCCNPNAYQGGLGPIGWRGRNLVTDGLIERIGTARRSILITSFYFKPVEPLLVALLGAARRGVRVEVHHSHREALPATDLAWIAAAACYGRLLEAGICVFENRRGEHSKIVLVDDEWTAFGSYNFEHAAHDRLAEAMLVSTDPEATQPAAAIFAGLRRHPDNVRVTEQALRDLPIRLKARRWFLGRFRRWM
ncbi:MAG: phosphatidylserine/phosphatidylglycerophosphate/cardiolipin synthase family protein [Acidobacteria bacterium]|nr:phosphatidylserine/phosphatidylglycerophosphate/cardiolipin synthase family protein [Acidobacteriota bacterium]